MLHRRGVEPVAWLQIAHLQGLVTLTLVMIDASRWMSEGAGPLGLTGGAK